jgi:enamine deaminase RidA (YjgF/YER057c/UK114 family)
VPPLAIENPRQVSAYRYPDAYGPRSPSFSRAAVVSPGDGRTMLFISGTASIVGHQTMHIGDVARQTEESLANIAAVLAVAAERAGAPFPHDALTYTVYVRRPADLPVVRRIFESAVGPRAASNAIYLQADICRAELLVEIEAHGCAFAETSSSETATP